MVLAFSYIRWSSKKQDKGDSLRRQKAARDRLVVKHNLTLDERNFEDLGVSAFRGKNRDEGALAAFLQAVENKTIPKGSWLILENLDRMSRQLPMATLKLLEEIVSKGITLATAEPERVYTVKSLGDTFALIEIILIAQRAHEESKTKSDRVREAWANKLKLAAESKELLSNRMPEWLIVDEGKIKPIPERVAIVKRIVSMALKLGM
jgi:DNA invertase Pin-like site-specific DNA recombinase